MIAKGEELNTMIRQSRFGKFRSKKRQSGLMQEDENIARP